MLMANQFFLQIKVLILESDVDEARRDLSCEWTNDGQSRKGSKHIRLHARPHRVCLTSFR